MIGKGADGAVGEGEEDDEAERREQEDDEQRAEASPQNVLATALIAASRATAGRCASDHDRERRREHREGHGGAERPVDVLAELHGDQVADHGDLAADQERRDVVAGRDQEAEDEGGDEARAGSAGSGCRSDTRQRARAEIARRLDLGVADAAHRTVDRQDREGHEEVDRA